jgi:hypothetical protein
MSALGQKQTFRTAINHVRFTPESGHQVLNQMQDRHCHAYGKQGDGNSQGN